MATDNRRSKTQRKDAQRPVDARVEEAIEPFGEEPEAALVFAREYYAYQTILMHIQGEANRRLEQVSQRFAIAVQQQQVDGNRLIDEVYRAYSAAFNRHQIDPEDVSLEAVDEAFQKYLKTHQQAQIDSHEAFEAARANHDQAIEAVTAEAEERRTAAFRDFVGAIREAWAGIDAADMTSSRLASIAQTTFAAATCAQIG